MRKVEPDEVYRFVQEGDDGSAFYFVDHVLVFSVDHHELCNEDVPSIQCYRNPSNLLQSACFRTEDSQTGQYKDEKKQVDIVQDEEVGVVEGLLEEIESDFEVFEHGEEELHL